jgi:syntaxin 8
LIRLRKFYDDLNNQFTAPLPTPSAVAQATTTPGRTNAGNVPYTDEEARDALLYTPGRRGKSVRFSESLVDDEDEIAGMDNTQLLAMHNRIISEQDESIDRLAESISRQRELSIQIGDELDSHAQLLDEVEILTDRHQSRLDNAKKRMDHIYRKASENCKFTPGKGSTSSLTICREFGGHRRTNTHIAPPHHYS